LYTLLLDHTKIIFIRGDCYICWEKAIAHLALADGLKNIEVLLLENNEIKGPGATVSDWVKGEIVSGKEHAHFLGSGTETGCSHGLN